MARTRGLLFFLLLISGLEIFSQSAVCAYGYRKRITFDPTKVSGAADLVDFPALINITSDNDLRTTGNGGHVQSGSGYDIIFVASDGITKLDHQLERYTASTGETVAWVRIPSLSTSVNTFIYMYYGNSAIGADQSVNTTWKTAYKGVWHLENGGFSDGTSNGNNATNGGSGNLTGAKIAGGRSFSGAGTNYLQLPLSGASGGSGNGSIEFWGLMGTAVSSTYFFGETTLQNASYANRVQIYVGDNTGNLYLGIGGNHAIQTNVQLLTAGTWYHIGLTWATTGSGVGTYSIYVNGVQKGSNSYSTFTAIHTFGDAGNDGNAGQRTEELTGSVDEFKVTNTTLNTDWFLTEYNNQNSPGTFYSISAEPKTWNGGNSTNFNTANNWLNNSAPSSGDDIIINNGTNQPQLQSNTQINSAFIRTGATFSLSNRNLSVRSDITNCGTITGETGMITLNSTNSFVQTQCFSGSGTFNLTDLTVNNAYGTSPQVTLNKNISVAGALVLTSGIVNTTATNILALGTGATSTSGSAASFVSGPMTKAGTANFVFPIGKGSSWRRAAVSNITSSNTFTGEYFNVPYSVLTPVNSPLYDISRMEYWQIDRTVGSGNANLSLYWEDATASGIDNCPDITIARFNGASWDERPGTYVAGSTCSGAGTGTVTTNAVLTAFSPFTFGSKSATLNPLPVKLIDFTASCEPAKVTLAWHTGSEVNNDYFVVERSQDGVDWTDIGHIPAQGTSLGHDYAVSDDILFNGILYYQLQQVDRNGTRTTLRTVATQCGSRNLQMLLYPNPSEKEFTVELMVQENYVDCELQVVDQLGRVCLSKPLTLHAGSNSFTVPHQLISGCYSLQIVSVYLAVPAQKLMIR